MSLGCENWNQENSSIRRIGRGLVTSVRKAGWGELQRRSYFALLEASVHSARGSSPMTSVSPCIVFRNYYQQEKTETKKVK